MAQNNFLKYTKSFLKYIMCFLKYTKFFPKIALNVYYITQSLSGHIQNVMWSTQNIPPNNALKKAFLTVFVGLFSWFLAVNYFHRKLHLLCLTGFWISPCCFFLLGAEYDSICSRMPLANFEQSLCYKRRPGENIMLWENRLRKSCA